MLRQRLDFPEGFLWGTATAGHQIEGHNYSSDWWEFEQAGKIDDGTVTGANVDYWNRYEEDHDLMAELGFQVFRLGIEWAKIEPEDGVIDRGAIEHYRKILQSLRDRDIKICLTIYHWVLPQWFAKGGGWLREDAVERFVDYAGVVARELGEFPDLWVTLNEPLVPALAGYLAGLFPPEISDFRSYCTVFNRLLRAHAGTYEAIHRYAPQAPDGEKTKAGVATAYQDIQPYGGPGLAGVYENIMAKVFAYGSFEAWDRAVKRGRAPFPYGSENIHLLKDSYDFCGVNYYTRKSLKFDPQKKDEAFVDMEAAPPGVETTQMGWQIYPPGFYKVLMQVWKLFGKPIYITENGIADDADKQRPGYTLKHIAQVHRAMEDGADIRGYMHWSYIDNFEWKEGFAKKFGLIECAHDDPQLERKPRKSARMYSEIIHENAITRDIVDRYAPGGEHEVLGEVWR